MRLVIIADTHGRHEDLGTLEGDVLIHCGDLEHLFAPDAVALNLIDAWFGQQKFDHILAIGGNHDLALERQGRAGDMHPFRNATYLQDSGIEIGGLYFYGAPWVPELRDHAFFADDATLKNAWAKIPIITDVLITHTPPLEVLDVSSMGLILGCQHLSDRVACIQPKLHCFGHVHAAAGIEEMDGTTFVNAAMVDRSFEICRKPFVFDVTPDGVQPVD